MEIPQRYKDMKLYLEGLHFAGFLEGDNSKLSFISSDKFWCSHLILLCGEDRGFVYNNSISEYVKKTDTNLFGVYYMKNKDVIWVKASIPCYSRSSLVMMSNILRDEIVRIGNYQMKFDIPQSFSSGKSYARVLIENHHSEDDVYKLFQLFRKFQTSKEYLMW